MESVKSAFNNVKNALRKKTVSSVTVVIILIQTSRTAYPVSSHTFSTLIKLNAKRVLPITIWIKQQESAWNVMKFILIVPFAKLIRFKISNMHFHFIISSWTRQKTQW